MKYNKLVNCEGNWAITPACYNLEARGRVNVNEYIGFCLWHTGAVSEMVINPN